LKLLQCNNKTKDLNISLTQYSTEAQIMNLLNKLNPMYKSFKDHYKLIIGTAAVIIASGIGMNNGKLALENGVQTKPDFMYDATGDGRLDGFYLRRTPIVLQGIYPEGGSIYFLDGKQLEKTSEGYKAHANPRRINGSNFSPKAGFRLPLSLIVGEFDGKEGIDAKITEKSSDFGVNYTTELNNLKIPKW